MLSRVADAIYWLCRYIERAENVARFVDVNRYLMMDLPDSQSGEWKSLITVTGDHKFFLERFDEATEENVIHFLTFDPENPNSILSCVRSARENARSIREIISSEMWEQVNRFYLMVTDPGAKDFATSHPHEFYENVKMASHLFTGLCEGTLTHSEGWHFTRLGRFIERADKTSRILDVKYFILLPEPGYVGSPYDSLQWAAVLKSASALEMYRKRHHRITPGSVVDFLILDSEFPRAIHYC
ncbi:MAG: alpha-E domain-containing protein, partial [Candidatus Omnitrophica bacterium]|nr:alpha-E domain-containing protein [Candidatus Omnitrophota bacterium]